jgi:outer membrane protein assembly factor BamB
VTGPRALTARAGVILAVLAASCASATVRRLEGGEAPAHPAGILQLKWRVTLHEHGLFEPAPEECATGVLARDRLVIGSRAGSVVGVDPDLGRIVWATPLSGGIDSEARYDTAHDQVYIGADDGGFSAIDPAGGAVRWTYRAKGAVERAPEMTSDMVFVSTAADRVVALESATGKWRWQYDRETPEGFTIHGYAGPRLRGSQVLAGFADGYLVSLAAASGDVQWARSLAAASDQFVDVDATPTLAGGVAYVSSYSGGLYALDPRDGGVRWRVGIEGVGSVTAAPAGDRLYFAAPRQGLHAADREGHVLWRQGLTEAGDLTQPQIVGRYLVFSGSRAGLFIVDRDGGTLLEVFNPGHGICAAPTVDTRTGRIYVLANGGSLYALDLT